ncbi:glycosyltransferase [Myroides odoratus]|uniref:glycosyltransferase n=1 Tax=Myroides odoratus TaxID=256 RepID=UPI0039B127E9
MYKLLFISGYRVDLLDKNGVAKKINLEIETYKKIGFLVDFLEFDLGKIFLNINDNRTFLVNESSSFYKSMDNTYKYLKDNINVLEHYDMIYLRYEHFSFSMISFFKKMKEINPNIKIVGELPTYMERSNQNSSLKTKILFKVKRFLNNNTYKYIDYLATFSNHERLFNMPTIQIENFVNIEKIELRQPIKNDVVDLLALAQITPAHGFDRVVRGLKNYYSKENIKQKVFLHIVGDGVEKKVLENLVKEYDLNKYVKFYGALGGKELDSIFNVSDIGIGSLAIFRKGSTKCSELKVREYTARGLPFIYSAEEPQIEEQKFAKKVLFNETAIEINTILEFYDEIYKNSDLLVEMRSFAEKEFTCECQLKKIVNTIFSK